MTVATTPNTPPVGENENPDEPTLAADAELNEPPLDTDITPDPAVEELLDTPKKSGLWKQSLLRTAAVVATCAILVGGFAAFETTRASAADLSTKRYDSAVSQFRTDRVNVYGSVATVRSYAQSAKRDLAAADGKVLNEAARNALQKLIVDAEAAATKANSDANNASTSVSKIRPDSTNPFTESDEFTAAAERVGKYRLSGAKVLSGFPEQLTAAVAKVKQATAAWQKEQERIAAEKAAAEAAAQAAAEAAERAAAEASDDDSGSSYSGGGPSSGDSTGDGGDGVDHDENVWTYGFQSEIDACNGSVNVTANYGTTAIAEHWSCGGSNFPTWSGATVRVQGAGVDGIYRVEGIVARLNVNTNTTADVPHGYDLIYQTCWNGDSSDMTLVGMTRIG